MINHLPQKIEVLLRFPFGKFGRRLNPPTKQKGGMYTMQLFLLTLTPLTRFSPGSFIVLQGTLYQPFFCSDWIIAKNNAFSK